MYDSSRWTPEFRVWFEAAYVDQIGDLGLLAGLDAAAQEAGESARSGGLACGVCPSCGRIIASGS